MSKTRNPDALIRIEDAIKVLCRETCHPGMLCPDNHCAEMWDEFEDVERVDAVPVRHGRWIMHEVQINGYSHAVYECTACGVRVPAAFVPLKYCSNCGAKLDRKDGNADGV